MKPTRQVDTRAVAISAVRLLPLLALLGLCGCGADSKPKPMTESCDNAVDDDADGKTDCADPDCFAFAACCVDLCDETSALCSNEGVRTCTRGAAGCRGLSTPMACASGTVCSGGACVPSCTDRCPAHARQCIAPGAAAECQQLATGCYDWVVGETCGVDSLCSAGTCIPISDCTPQCSAGADRCAGNGNVQTCVSLGNGCTDWAFPAACSDTLVCFQGACGVAGLDGGEPPDAGAASDADAGTWESTNVPSPSGRGFAAMAFDDACACVVLVGGRADGRQLADLWEWDGSAWHPGGFPYGALQGPLMVYDSVRSTLVFFARGSHQTLERTAGVWNVPAPAHSPGLTTGAKMVFDELRGRTVLVGRGQAGQLETWEWDGSDWTLMPTAVTPSPRYEMALAWDAARQRTVLFGGFDPSAAPLGDTWEWNGTAWSQRLPANSPRARALAAMAYDARRQRLVLVGGIPTNSSFPLGDSWEWDGTDWLATTGPQPPARQAAALAYDPVRERLVLYGGLGNNASAPYLSDTWERW